MRAEIWDAEKRRLLPLTEGAEFGTCPEGPIELFTPEMCATCCLRGCTLVPNRDRNHPPKG